jgi:hypothetical protein
MARDFWMVEAWCRLTGGDGVRVKRYGNKTTLPSRDGFPRISCDQDDPPVNIDVVIGVPVVIGESC